MSEPPNNPADLSDHDLLIRIDERTIKLDQCLTSHLRRHWAITAAAVTAVLGALFSIAVAAAVAWR